MAPAASCLSVFSAPALSDKSTALFPVGFLGLAAQRRRLAADCALCSCSRPSPLHRLPPAPPSRAFVPPSPLAASRGWRGARTGFTEKDRRPRASENPESSPRGQYCCCAVTVGAVASCDVTERVSGAEWARRARARGVAGVINAVCPHDARACLQAEWAAVAWGCGRPRGAPDSGLLWLPCAGLSLSPLWGRRPEGCRDEPGLARTLRMSSATRGDRVSWQPWHPEYGRHPTPVECPGH